MTTTVGERVKEVREELGLKPSAFAKGLGISQPTLWDIENGQTKKPSAETMQRMRERYGVNPDYIMRAKGPKLLDDIERKLKAETLWSMIGELDEGEQEMVEDVVKGIIRRKKASSPNDPFKKDAPGQEGTQ